MSGLRKTILTIFLVLSIFMLLATWYKYEYSMNKVEAYEFNTQEYTRHLVVATQGSDFKNAVTKAVVNHYKDDSIFIKVIDISSLSDIEPRDSHAILLIHTWENWKPPIDVKSFIGRSTDHMGKIIVLTTSGEGSYKMDSVDAITGESKLENKDHIVNQIIERLNPLLNHKK